MRAHHWLLAITWIGLFFIGIISYSLFQSGRPQVNPLLAMLVFISVYVPIVISAVMLVIAKRDERIYRVFVSLLTILLPGLSTFSVLFSISYRHMSESFGQTFCRGLRHFLCLHWSHSGQLELC